MSPRTRIALAVVLVAAAGPAGFLAYRFLLANHLASAPSERQLTRELASSSQPTAAPETHRSIPEQLPDITLPDRKGTLRKLSDWRGRPLLVNFWATWCEPCRREIPLLETLRQMSPADHLQVVGIAVDDRGAVLKYARAMKIDYPVLIGGEAGGLEAISAFGMEAVLPFTVFADSMGRILTVKVGELHRDEARLILARLEDVDAGRLTEPAARKQISAGLETLAVQRAKHPAPKGS